MDTKHTLEKVIAGTLLSGGVLVTGIGLTLGTAQALPGSAPPILGLLPEDGPQPVPHPVPPGQSGPYVWCPGDPLSGLRPQAGRGGPGRQVQWDTTRCHTWWGLPAGRGNAGPGVWDGPDPPPPELTQKPPCGFPFMCSGTP
jgi:hypothetical protein